MKKMVLFVVAILVILSLISLRGITGYASADIPSDSEYVNIGISAIGLVIVALLFTLRSRTVFTQKNDKADNRVWEELEQLEKEWQRKK